MFYAKTNRNKEALTEFEKSKKLFYEGGRIYNIVSFEIEMSKILLKTEKLNSAKEFALECYHEAYRAGLKEQIRDASALLSDINRKLGNFEEALHYQTSYINYKDSIKNEEIIRKMADLRTEYEISQKQMVIDLLEKKRSVTRAALITVLAILIVVFILAYLLHSNNKLVKNQRRKLIRQKSDLQDINKAKDKMFSIISHDLRGPIHSIAGLSSMLKELVINEETGELLELTDHMNNSLENISFLLDNLLEWASNQQGYLVYNPGRFRLRDVFESLKEIFSNTARAKGVEIILEIDPKSEICTDKNFFSTIFRNLIGNAVKYTKAGDSITITCDNIPGRIRISVADTGVGIPKEKIPNLFELSDRNSTWGTANEKGIGLGLQLVHEFTLMSNGEIFVESEVGKGTTFQVVFPADLVAC
jgi:signal transduction histidine kinase